MDRNVGGRDRTLRAIAGAALVLIGYRKRGTNLGRLCSFVGTKLLSTALLRRCPVNAALGIDTCSGGR